MAFARWLQLTGVTTTVAEAARESLVIGDDLKRAPDGVVSGLGPRRPSRAA